MADDRVAKLERCLQLRLFEDNASTVAAAYLLILSDFARFVTLTLQWSSRWRCLLGHFKKYQSCYDDDDDDDDNDDCAAPPVQRRSVFVRLSHRCKKRFLTFFNVLFIFPTFSKIKKKR